MDVSGTIAELKSCVGIAGPEVVVEVDRTAARLLMESVEGQCIIDMENTEIPAYLICASMVSGRGTWPQFPWPFRRGVDGGGEWESNAPIRLGDRITSVTRLVDFTERDGKSGKMGFLTFETVHRNQHGLQIGKTRSTVIGMDPIS